MFVHISLLPGAVSETMITFKFVERVASVEHGASKANKGGGEVRELKEQIACPKATLSKKEGEREKFRAHGQAQTYIELAEAMQDLYSQKTGKKLET